MYMKEVLKFDIKQVPGILCIVSLRTAVVKMSQLLSLHVYVSITNKKAPKRGCGHRRQSAQPVAADQGQ